MAYFEPNYWAIIAAAALAFVLDALWYSVLFGRLWVRLHGYGGHTAEELAAAHERARTAHVVSLVGYLFVAAALSLLADYIVLTSVEQALKLALLAFFGFVGPVGVIGSMYADRPVGAWLIDAGYQLLYLVVMSLVVVLWA